MNKFLVTMPDNTVIDFNSFPKSIYTHVVASKHEFYAKNADGSFTLTGFKWCVMDRCKSLKAAQKTVAKTEKWVNQEPVIHASRGNHWVKEAEHKIIETKQVK